MQQLRHISTLKQIEMIDRTVEHFPEVVVQFCDLLEEPVVRPHVPVPPELREGVHRAHLLLHHQVRHGATGRPGDKVVGMSRLTQVNMSQVMNQVRFFDSFTTKLVKILDFLESAPVNSSFT